MHYYKFNIADWSLHTAHLSLIEEAIYFRLVNYYYDTEKPIPHETQLVTRRLRLETEAETVSVILSEFFTLKDDQWFHSRCEKEIKDFKKKAKVNKVNGAKGGRPRNSKGPESNPEITQTVSESNPDITLTTNQEPLTKNHKPGIKDPLSCKPDCADVINHMNSVLGTKYKTSTKSHIQNISARLSDGHSVDDLKSVIDSKSKEWGGDPKMAQYLRPQTLFGASKFQGYLTATKTIATGQHRNINDIGKDFSPPPGFTPMKFDDNGNVIS